MPSGFVLADAVKFFINSEMYMATQKARLDKRTLRKKHI